MWKIDIKNAILFSLLVILMSCTNNEENEFSHCSDALTACLGFQEGTYCLFGLKWGEDPVFQNMGVDATGPQSSGGVITYSFLSESRTISSGQDANLKTVPFDNKGACARDEARAALAEWAKHGDFSFEELEDNVSTDIQFVAANGVVAALGNPNYDLQTCSGLSGKIFFSESELPCDFLYTLFLHEIGHALGLGHVDAPTIMGRGGSQGITDLQTGDLDGIRAIYGEK